ALAVGLDDVDAVGHGDSGHALLVAVELRVLVDVVEDLTGERLRILGLPAIDLHMSFVELSRRLRRGRRGGEQRSEERKDSAGAETCDRCAGTDWACVHEMTPVFDCGCICRVTTLRRRIDEEVKEQGPRDE